MAGTWTCSEDEDFGSLGDNKVIVTGGTSGTPAQFSDFVTADRAGEAVLLAATAGLSPSTNRATSTQAESTWTGWLESPRPLRQNHVWNWR